MQGFRIRIPFWKIVFIQWGLDKVGSRSNYTNFGSFFSIKIDWLTWLTWVTRLWVLSQAETIITTLLTFGIVRKCRMILLKMIQSKILFIWWTFFSFAKVSTQCKFLWISVHFLLNSNHRGFIISSIEILLKMISEDLGLMNTPYKEFTNIIFNQILYCAVLIIFSAFWLRIGLTFLSQVTHSNFIEKTDLCGDWNTNLFQKFGLRHW